MPLVTGTLADIGLDPLAGFQPILRFRPNAPAASATGVIFPTKPVDVTPASDGSFSVDLASTDDVLPGNAHWRLTIEWLSPDGYGSGGYSASDHASWKIRVPAGGGLLADMLDVPPRVDAVWVDIVPPPTDGYLYWIDTSTSPATLNVWSA